jgi:hypothetical protein
MSQDDAENDGDKDQTNTDTNEDASGFPRTLGGPIPHLGILHDTGCPELWSILHQVRQLSGHRGQKLPDNRQWGAVVPFSSACRREPAAFSGGLASR